MTQEYQANTATAAYRSVIRSVASQQRCSSAATTTTAAAAAVGAVAVGRNATTTATPAAADEVELLDYDEHAIEHGFARTCILGCQVNKLALCRFPVYDHKRCSSWLKFFDISAERVRELGGLANLRICLKHFNQKQQMAKTRIKTTPTRLQKDAMITSVVSSVTTSAGSGAGVGAAATAGGGIADASGAAIIVAKAMLELKKKTEHTAVNKQPPLPQQQQQQQQLIKSQQSSTPSTIIIAAPPKRTNSISSVTSTLSDNQSVHSDYETPATPQNGLGQSKRLINAASANGSNNNNSNNMGTITNDLLRKLHANPKRKVYMITEKTDGNGKLTATSAATAQGNNGLSGKRKMYLIMEEQGSGTNDGGDTQNSMSTQATEHKRKKLTLFADTASADLTQNFEKILPEILNRIKEKNGGGGVDDTVATEVKPPKPPITLPPKKNRTKILCNDLANNHGHQVDIIYPVANNYKCNGQLLRRDASPPPLVSVSNGGGGGGGGNGNDDNAKPSQTEKHINLSGDFLFLMKMLPKLESIPEPRKQQVKDSIEIFINRSASKYEQD